MRQQIITIRKLPNGISTETIYEVSLSNKEIFPISLLIEYIDMGVYFYYINKQQEEIQVESFHPLYKPSFIRSVNHVGVIDGLLCLPLI